MAMRKIAYARVVEPCLTVNKWQATRTAAKHKAASNLIEKATEIFGESFNPDDYLLTHATIVSSVTTNPVENVRLGSMVDEYGQTINRIYPDYRITPDTEKYINNNLDAFSRGVLLKSYKTFVGARNHVEHDQRISETKGRIIDAVVRDIGETLYVDILVATDRKHKDLIDRIESGEITGMSMGCFVAGTRVTMADGTWKAIENVLPDEKVITHTGDRRVVSNLQIRKGVWDMVTLKAVGVQEITSTTNHPILVIRPPNTCACGCGTKLVEKTSVGATLSRKFISGHTKRIYNPKKRYASTLLLEEAKENLTNLISGQPTPEFIPAGEIRKGDLLCFPIRQGSSLNEDESSIRRARILGLFLAEGSYLKYNNSIKGVEFSFSMDERHTLMPEIVELVSKEFPGTKYHTRVREDRGSSSVQFHSKEFSDWCYQLAGEYSHEKILHEDVYSWSSSAKKELFKAWLAGDGAVLKSGTAQVVTCSKPLIAQMQFLLTTIGIHSIVYPVVNGKRASFTSALAIEKGDNGKRPYFILSVNRKQLSLMETGVRCQNARQIGDYLVYPVTSTNLHQHTGLVYDLEVEGDHSYIANGVAVHNCNIQFSQCTKCGHVAYDDTDQCSHVRYQKGQKFTDEQGKSKIIAELCGHHTVDPNGGVTFIEASWVADPAFKGAVVRNILTGESVSEGAKKKAQQILSSPPREWIEGQERKKASSYRNAFDFGDDTGSAEGEGDAPAEDAPAETEEKKDPIVVFVEAYKMKVREMAAKELNKELEKPMTDKQVADTAPASMNESLIKEANSSNSAFSLVSQFISKVASNEKDFLFRVASYHRALGIEMDPSLYWAASKNPIILSDTPGTYLKACQFDLKRKVTKPEAEFLIRVGHLIRRFNDSRDPRNSNK